MPQMSTVVSMYLPTLFNLGVRSSKWPIVIFPRANMILTIAISNQSDPVVNITYVLFVFSEGEHIAVVVCDGKFCCAVESFFQTFQHIDFFFDSIEECPDVFDLNVK